jgi:hypothetical protein
LAPLSELENCLLLVVMLRIPNSGAPNGGVPAGQDVEVGSASGGTLAGPSMAGRLLTRSDDLDGWRQRMLAGGWY